MTLDEEIQAIENVLSELKELEKYKRKHSLIKNHYISKDKIRDKIEEYKKRKENCNDIEMQIRLDVKIRAYEELLEEEK